MKEMLEFYLEFFQGFPVRVLVIAVFVMFGVSAVRLGMKG